MVEAEMTVHTHIQHTSSHTSSGLKPHPLLESCSRCHASSIVAETIAQCLLLVPANKRVVAHQAPPVWWRRERRGREGKGRKGG